jgi:hypothetical protein
MSHETLNSHWGFEWAYRFSFQGLAAQQEYPVQILFLDCYTLKVEEAQSSKTEVTIFHSTLYNISSGTEIHQCRCQKLKSYILYVFWRSKTTSTVHV